MEILIIQPARLIIVDLNNKNTQSGNKSKNQINNTYANTKNNIPSFKHLKHI